MERFFLAVFISTGCIADDSIKVPPQDAQVQVFMLALTSFAVTKRPLLLFAR